jgi:hypothetical protein
MNGGQVVSAEKIIFLVLRGCLIAFAALVE